MAVKTTIRTPMSVKMRAKQFAMFDALKGLREAIAEKEQHYSPRKELSEDRITEISQQLSLINKGDYVSISYYCQYGKQYRRLSGHVLSIDCYWKAIQIGTVSISFDEILEIDVTVAIPELQ